MKQTDRPLMSRPPKKYPSDSLDLEVKVCEEEAVYGLLYPDPQTKTLGDHVTSALTCWHVAALEREGKRWDGQFCFMSRAVLNACQMFGFDPIQVEIVRRGHMPFGQITVQEAQAIWATFS